MVAFLCSKGLQRRQVNLPGRVIAGGVCIWRRHAVIPQTDFQPRPGKRRLSFFIVAISDFQGASGVEADVSVQR